MSGTTDRARAAAASYLRRAAGNAAVSRMAALVFPGLAILPLARAPRQPILVIGCPRSGTTLLFRALSVSPELRTLGGEGHVLWEAFNHPSRHGWSSDALGPGDVTPGKRQYAYLAIRLLAGRHRFLDKTPKNCLRVAYLSELFPDARFVFLRRQAADNVNSLIAGWRARPRFVSYRLPEPLEGLGSLSGREWSFVLIPGWRELRRAPLEVICARQYVECNRAILRARAELDPARTIDVAYEDLVEHPADEIARLFAELGLDFTQEAAQFAAAVRSTPINSLTPPKPGKWREQNPEEIRRILPLVAQTERRLGYGA